MGLVIKSLQFSCFDDFAKGSIHVFGASKVRNSAQTNQVSKVIKTSAQTSKKISKIPSVGKNITRKKILSIVGKAYKMSRTKIFRKKIAQEPYLEIQLKVA